VVDATIASTYRNKFANIMVSGTYAGAEIASPASPPAGYDYLYAKAGGRFYLKDSANNEEQLLVSSELSRANVFLTNGGFEVWQRGANFSHMGYSATAFGPDMWRWVANGGSTQGIISSDIAVYDGGGGTSCKITHILLGTESSLRQDLTDPTLLRQLRGRTITFSCRVKTNVANGVKVKGYGGSVATESAFHSADNTWQTMSVTFSIDANATAAYVYLTLTASGTFNFDNATLTIGSVPQIYTPRHPSADLLDCLRYCQVYGGTTTYDRIGWGFINGTAGATFGVRWVAPMGGVPSITFNNPALFAVHHSVAGGTTTPCTVLGAGGYPYGCDISVTTAGGLTLGQGATFLTNASTTARMLAEWNP